MDVLSFFTYRVMQEEHQLCSGLEYMIDYHKIVKKTEKIEVDQWEPALLDLSNPQPSCMRRVVMWQPLEVPYLIKRLIGKSIQYMLRRWQLRSISVSGAWKTLTPKSYHSKSGSQLFSPPTMKMPSLAKFCYEDLIAIF